MTSMNPLKYSQRIMIFTPDSGLDCAPLSELLLLTVGEDGIRSVVFTVSRHF